mgnify:CR=1 FL=1
MILGSNPNLNYSFSTQYNLLKMPELGQNHYTTAKNRIFFTLMKRNGISEVDISKAIKSSLNRTRRLLNNPLLFDLTEWMILASLFHTPVEILVCAFLTPGTINIVPKITNNDGHLDSILELGKKMREELDGIGEKNTD